ncbi:hypothetical protein MSAN_00155000 [Mycena sanguinolenta]|uniref:Uncharacterized protein n=1 Tax=Mycena sanguinolenta TaxID=230812 RepID=A0A8H6ZE38_9AGAR|nr:hypothetical protein MSAN_00155000 [Mycena sanguinolenta]
MPDHPKKPKPSSRGKFKHKRDQLSSTLKEGLHKPSSKLSPAASPPSSRSATPAPSNRQGDKTHALVPGALQSEPNSSKQEEDKAVGPKMAENTQKHSPVPSLQSTTPVPTSSQGSSAGQAYTVF